MGGLIQTYKELAALPCTPPSNKWLHRQDDYYLTSTHPFINQTVRTSQWQPRQIPEPKHSPELYLKLSGKLVSINHESGGIITDFVMQNASEAYR